MPKITRPTQGLLALTILCVAVIGLRVILKDNTRYSFLLWNLFLAWMPLLIIQIAANARKTSLQFALLMLWLLFLPNSPYIITDLLHLKNYNQNILWFDSLTIFTFAATGVLIGLQSLLVAHGLFKRHFTPYSAWGIILLCHVLSGFGIYLGRYCRLNSWDLFNRPLWFAGRILHQFENPLAYKLTLAFSFVLFVFYAVFKNFYAPAVQAQKR